MAYGLLATSAYVALMTSPESSLMSFFARRGGDQPTEPIRQHRSLRDDRPWLDLRGGLELLLRCLTLEVVAAIRSLCRAG